ncbi:MAG: hypothetical protein IJQ00_06625, partial [Kiritimatiellae bacterium]|nr:hypothetical protein [Kiritimatiellia bacterium]
VFLVWPCGGRGATALPGSDGRARAPRAPFPRVDMPNGEVVAASVKETVTPVLIEDTEKTPASALNNAKWIWHPVDPQAQGKVTFTSKIDAAAACDAEIVFTCDNAAFVSVNGKEVAKKEFGNNYEGWRSLTQAKFPLQAGRNEITVLADNALPGDAGFVCAITWPTGQLLSDGQTWKVCRAGEAAVKAREICRFGQGVWGRLGAKPKFTRSPFAESVATELAFTLPALKPGERVYLACDDVEGEKSAAVTVNGAYAGGFIGRPYRLDVTKSVKAGANALETKPFRLEKPRIVVVR